MYEIYLCSIIFTSPVFAFSFRFSQRPPELLRGDHRWNGKYFYSFMFTILHSLVFIFSFRFSLSGFPNVSQRYQPDHRWNGKYFSFTFLMSSFYRIFSMEDYQVSTVATYLKGKYIYIKITPNNL